MHAPTHACERKRNRTASPGSVTDNVIREKGKSKRRAPPHRGVSVTCLMDSAEHVITVGGAVREESRLFSPSTRAGSRSGLGPDRFIHSCEKYACRVSRTVQHAARTQVDLNNPASRSFEHACGAADS